MDPSSTADQGRVISDRIKSVVLADSDQVVVDSTGPAVQAGIQGGNRPVVIGGQAIPDGSDIIVAADGRPVTSTGGLRAYIENNTSPVTRSPSPSSATGRA